jgi:hypothetical protein
MATIDYHFSARRGSDGLLVIVPPSGLKMVANGSHGSALGVMAVPESRKAAPSQRHTEQGSGRHDDHGCAIHSETAPAGCRDREEQRMISEDNDAESRPEIGPPEQIKIAGEMIARYLTARDNGESLGEPEFDDCCLNSDYGIFLARKLRRLWRLQDVVRGSKQIIA